MAIKSSTLSEFLIELESQLDSYTSTGIEVRSHDLIRASDLIGQKSHDFLVETKKTLKAPHSAACI